MGWEDGQDLLALALCETWRVGAPAIGTKRGTDVVGALRVTLSGCQRRGQREDEVFRDMQGAELWVNKGREIA